MLIITDTFCSPELTDPDQPPNYKFPDGTPGWQTLIRLVDFMDAITLAKIPPERMFALAKRCAKYYPEYVTHRKDGAYRFKDAIPGKIVASIVFDPYFTWSRNSDTNKKLPIVKIKDGILLPDSGPLCKKIIGGTSGSTIHPIWKDNPEEASDVISDLQLITTVLITRIGFSVGLSDCISNGKVDVKGAIKSAMIKCEIINASEKSLAEKELEINGALNEAMSISTELAKSGMNKGDRNAFVIMKKSGAKGTDVNNGQIAGFVGQQNIDGMRIPFMLCDGTRSLPYFGKDDYSPASKGFVENSFLQGLTPYEMWFHAMGGRRGVVDTALKSVTGDTLIDVYIPFSLTKWRSDRLAIGDFVDYLLKEYKRKVTRVNDSDRGEMELLELSKCREEKEYYISTIDLEGHYSLGCITAVTRHSPTNVMYEITTEGGRSVIVTDSKSLLVFNRSTCKFEQTFMKDVQVGDQLPVSPDENDIKYIALDPIVSLTKIDPSPYRYVYDLTVPSTTNFGLANGLYVVDTADSGYVEKKIVNMINDLKIAHDGTVRDANGSVVQFHCGGDGFNAKEMIGCKGLDDPFFINPPVIVDCLNSEAEQTVSDTERGKKRCLHSDEMNLVLSKIGFTVLGEKTRVTERATFNTRKCLRKVCDTVQLYECMIPRFCRRVMDEFEEAKAKQGYMAGLVAALSMGEPTTQLSNAKHEKLPLMFVNLQDGTRQFYNGEIGTIIDAILEEGCKSVVTKGDNCIGFPEPDIYVHTVDPKTSKCAWKKILEVSRHPANGGMVKVNTKSGRSVTTTLSHSHLKRNEDGTISPIKGSSLKVGDFIPVCNRLDPMVSITEITTEGKTYTLDFDTGWMFGAYLSEGNVNGGQIVITNMSDAFERRCKIFADKYGGKTRKTQRYGNILGSKKQYLQVQHHISGCTPFGRYLIEECGHCCENKHVPPFAFFAPDDFVAGLLRGYFDGDGNVSAERQLIRVHSISKDLIETIGLLLTRFGIFGTIGIEHKERPFPLYSYRLLRKYAATYLEKVGCDLPEETAAIEEIISYNEREDIHSRREDIDVIPGIGQTISNTARPLKLSGYSRLYKRHEKKKFTGKETVRKYVEVFEKEGASGKDFDILKNAVDSDVLWDEIISLERLEDPKELVYDIGVAGNHTFMIQNGIFTHNTLNSVDWDTLVAVRFEKEVPEIIDPIQSQGSTALLPIGKLIDTLIEQNSERIENHPNETEYVDISHLGATVTSVDEDGKMHWKKLTAVTRHLPGGKLVHVKTRSGREVRATKSKSFLVRENNKIVPKLGSEIERGNHLPVVMRTNDLDFTHLSYDYTLGCGHGQDLASDERKLNPEGILLAKIIPLLQSLDYIYGVIHGYFCTMVRIVDKTLAVRCSNVAFLFLAELLSRFGIFARRAEDDLVIDKHFVQVFYNSIYLRNYVLQEQIDGLIEVLESQPEYLLDEFDVVPGVVTSKLNGCYQRNYLREQLKTVKDEDDRTILQNAVDSDVYFDEIVSVEEVESSHPKVYDFTVEDTRTFTLFGGLTVYDTFHAAGLSAKDVTLGVPRLKEILNATKNPSKPGCTVYLNDFNIQNLLEKKDLAKTEDGKAKIDQEVMFKTSDFANHLPNIKVSDLLVSHELKYLPDEDDDFDSDEDDDTPTKASPIGLVTYHEYKPEWWTELWQELGNTPKHTAQKWIILLTLNTDVMYKHKITTAKVAEAIERGSFGSRGYALTCIPSPNNVAKIEVYINFDEIDKYIRNGVELPASEQINRTLITKDNVDYYIARDVALDIVKKTVVTGVARVEKTYIRQDYSTGEWTIDTQGSNLQELLGIPGVDTTRTISDDMWEVYTTLGLEATRTFLAQEITKILSFDGTYINKRHIFLLVDAMLRYGTITPVSRDGISRDVGPIAKGLFEKTVENFAESSCFAEQDMMQGVAASIMYGTLPPVGTGTVEIKDGEKLPGRRGKVKGK